MGCIVEVIHANSELQYPPRICYIWQKMACACLADRSDYPLYPPARARQRSDICNVVLVLKGWDQIKGRCPHHASFTTKALCHMHFFFVKQVLHVVEPSFKTYTNREKSLGFNNVRLRTHAHPTVCTIPICEDKHHNCHFKCSKTWQRDTNYKLPLFLNV